VVGLSGGAATVVLPPLWVDSGGTGRATGLPRQWVEADLSTQARVKAAYEFTAQPKLGNGDGALERWPRKQALTIGRGAGTEQRGDVGLSHGERIAN
jgi:hypothetical protein